MDITEVDINKVVRRTDMKMVLSRVSTYLFVVGLAAYFSFLFGIANFLLIGIIASTLGLIVAFFGERSIYKKIGIIGNALIILIGIIFSIVVVALFWK